MKRRPILRPIEVNGNDELHWLGVTDAEARMIEEHEHHVDEVPHWREDPPLVWWR